jgi:glycosyltransferase involved in cell wall biosynthesis
MATEYQAANGAEQKPMEARLRPRVSLYIPCYNVEKYLPPVLEAVFAQTLPPDEVLIVDDGSRDRTCEIAARYPVTILKHEQNRGLAAARNTGVRAARNDLVASLDADCIAEPLWLERLAEPLAASRVAMAGGRLVETVLTSIADRWRKAHMPQDWGGTPVVNPRFLFGCNTILKKPAAGEAGGYDVNMRTAGEDVDFSQRLRALGYDLVYEPAAVVRHIRRDTIPSVLDAYWRWWFFGVKAYRSGFRLRSVMGHFLYVHLGSTFVKLVREDLRSRDWELVLLDLLALGYMPYRDFGLYLKNRGAPQAPAVSHEVRAP